MTTDNNGSNAPAGGNAVPADPMARGSAVDLSDLQAELDKTSKTEQPGKGNASREGDSSSEGSEGDDTTETTEDDAEDPFNDEETEGDGEETDDDEGDDGGEEDEGEEDKPKKKSRNSRYRDRIKNLEAEVAKLASRTAAVSAEAIEAEVLSRVGAEPQEKDFPDYLTWEREHTAWLLDKRQTTRAVKTEAKHDVEAQTRANVERVGRHKERVEQFGKSGLVKDFDKVMLGAKDAKCSPVVEDLILDSDKSGHLVFYFAKNAGRLAKINAMTPRDAAREIGRIESRLSLPKPRVQSKAPAPPRSRPGGGGASNTSQDAQLDGYLNKTYGKGRR